jgi:hypothetical protein
MAVKQRKNHTLSARSMLASYDLNRLGVNPIEEAVKAVRELDELKKTALEAFKQMRGYGESGDAGTQYLATAVKCVAEKASINLKLARFKHPELSAVAFKDVSGDHEETKPMTTLDAVNIIKNDPFAPAAVKNANTDDVLKAMESPLETPFLPIGSND